MTKRASLACAALAALAVTGAAAGDPPAAPTRTIEVAASRFKFEPELIQVAEGEHIVVNARAVDGKSHGFAIKELGLKAALPKTGEVVPIEFTVEKAGTYTISCSVYCGSGHSRMRGRLVVTPR
jgi:cytochrome c oxidase subunit 2